MISYWLAVPLIISIICLLLWNHSSKKKGDDPFLDSSSFPVRAGYAGIVPLSLVIPCTDADFLMVKRVIDSALRQTALSRDIIIILASPNVTRVHEVMIEVEESFGYQSQGIRAIPRFHSMSAGQNRMFGMQMAKHELVSFFDCDDIMHPQRNELISNTFRRHPDLSAMAHFLKYASCDLDYDYGSFPVLEFNNDTTYRLLWPYDMLIDDPMMRNGEPNTWHDAPWYFPAYMELDPPLRGPIVANGPISVNKTRVAEVPFSLIRLGEDSLYIWRLLKAKKNFTLVPVELLAYCHPRIKGLIN
eukprot:GHVU01118739.1.p1 GENE.GHVU01118739.1~~GHVU01118739.1.p1  ORF type:complete len:302 (-),score=21.22 GHVU01118739.1:225-1130(-)